MKAAVVAGLPATTSRSLRSRSPRPARPDEVVIRVDACGICGTDLHILAGHSYRPELPFVLGHEPVGRCSQPERGAQTGRGSAGSL